MFVSHEKRTCRAMVYSLVVGVPDASYTTFRSYEGAMWDYHTAKKEGRVRSIREPGDEEIFGHV